MPDIKELYKKCFHPDTGKPLADINATAVTGWGRKFHTLSAAASCNNADIIEYLMKEGAHGFYDAAKFAVYNDNSEALNELLPKIIENADSIYKKYLQTPDSRKLPAIINDATLQVKVEANLACDALLFGSHEAYKTIIAGMNETHVMALKYRFVLSAAEGGNELSLADCLNRLHDDDFKKEVPPTGTGIFLRKILMEKAIHSHNPASVQILLDLKHKYTEEEKAAFLVQAIQQNNYVIVDKLLDNTGFTVEGIFLSTRGAAHTAFPV